MTCKSANGQAFLRKSAFFCRNGPKIAQNSQFFSTVRTIICDFLSERSFKNEKRMLFAASSRLSGGTVSRFLFYPVIYLRNLPPGKGGQPFRFRPKKESCQYTWSCRPWCRHRHMSPYGVVSPYLTVSPLPLRAVCFLLRHP